MDADLLTPAERDALAAWDRMLNLFMLALGEDEPECEEPQAP